MPADGCKASGFDQCGDLEAFGVHPDWMRQLTKFASVQDRLRERQPAVMDRLFKFSCTALKALGFDTIRIDKATRVTVETMAMWVAGVRKCATKVGKINFIINGEVNGGNTPAPSICESAVIAFVKLHKYSIYLLRWPW